MASWTSCSGNAGGQQLGGEGVPKAVWADLVGGRDAGSTGQAPDELVGDRVAHPLVGVGVEEERPRGALADVVLKGTEDDGRKGFGRSRTRTVDTHACRLRHKLAAAGGAYVHNVWGVGYRLLATVNDPERNGSAA